MQPTDPDVRVVLEREAELLRPEVRADPGALRDLLHPDFFEFGVTRCTDLADVLERLPAEPGPDRTMIDPRVAQLAPEVMLVTYRLDTGARASLRSSIWVRSGSGWQMRFHQGTPVVDHIRLTVRR